MVIKFGDHIIRILSSALFVFICLSLPAYGRVVFPRDPDRKSEKLYAEAVLAYYEKRYDAALKALDTILKTNENQKTYELKGLVLKSSGKISEARKTYNSALEKMKAAGLAKAEGLSIYFEMAVLEFIENKTDSAKKLFDYCITSKFNVGAAKLFRAIIYTRNGKIDEAVLDYRSVLESDATSLRSLAALNLADLSARTQHYEDAVYFLAQARELAETESGGQTFEISEELLTLRRLVSERIKENMDKINEPQYFRSVAGILSYDSNVLSVPFSGSVSDNFSNKSSTKSVIKGLIGRAEGFFQESQTIWSYQFTGNLNQNRETETGQFMMNDFNYVINEKPYAATSKGLRFSGTAIFQYQVNPGTGKGAFGPYSLAAVAGQSLRERISNERSRSWEYSVRIESYLQDPAFSNYMKKTGIELSAYRVESWDRKVGYYNPSAAVQLRTRYSSGEEYRNAAAGLSLNNQAYFSEDFSMSLSLGFSYVYYYQRPGIKRTDKILTATLDQSYQVTKDLSALLNLEYTDNNSNIADIYKFDRYTASLGVAFSF